VLFLLSMLALLALVPSAASAKHPSRSHGPHHNRGLTIAATPNPIVTGDAVTIYGRLKGANSAGRTITLWHRIAGQPRFTVVQRVKTDAAGFYLIQRKPGVVTTNRSWFATAGRGVHSRTVHERVAAAVSLDPLPTTAETNQVVAFTGRVAPNHAGGRIVLQSQDSPSGNGWRTIDQARIGAGSAFRIEHRFRQPGDRTLRVLFRGDRRNVRAASDVFSIAVSQKVNPAFTLGVSQNPILVGQTVTLNGTLAAPDNAGVGVTLYGRSIRRGYRALATTTTDAAGNYTFAQTPANTMVYQVRTSAPRDRRASAQLTLGVQSTVTFTASTTSAPVGQPVTFTGTVAPSKVGHRIELQRQFADGNWYTVASTRVRGGSTYTFVRAFGAPGIKQLRVLVPGGPANARGISGTLPVTITPAPASTLAPAS
jgi:hypothetical protein